MKGKILTATLILMFVFAGAAYADNVIRSNETRGEEPAPSDATISDNATQGDWIIAPSPNEAAKDGDTPVSVDEQGGEDVIPTNATADGREISDGKGEAPEDDTTIGVDDWVIAPQGEVDDAVSGANSGTYIFAVPLVCGAVIAAGVGLRRRRH